MVVLSVFYPASENAHFDKAYYDAKHIPMVKDVFSATGLTNVYVFHGLGAPDGGPALYVAMAHLVFESSEAMQASMQSARAGEVFADVAKFTDIQPISQLSAVS